MPDAKRALFRTDASAQIGAGHAVRCLALADRLAANGWRCDFLIRPDSSAFFASSSHELRLLPGGVTAGEEAAALAPTIGGTSYQLAVVDHYGLDAGYETALRAFAPRLLAMDDRPLRAHDCAILLDPAPQRDAEAYRRFSPPEALILAGPDYALLRPEFAQLRELAKQRRDKTERAEKLLISLGGGDMADAIKTSLQGVAMAGLDLKVDIVAGYAPAVEDRLRDIAHRLGLDVGIHVATKEMARLMTEADICIGAAGGSALERCCLGLPTLMLQLADNQADISAALDDMGAAAALGPLSSGTASAIAEGLRRLTDSRETYARMSACAFAVCDGQGADRVARIIEEWHP